MPANKTNYIVLFHGNSQVYGTGSLDIALATPPPEGFTLEDKQVLFISQQPDTDELMVRPLPKEEVMSAEIQIPKKKKSKDDE